MASGDARDNGDVQAEAQDIHERAKELIAGCVLGALAPEEVTFLTGHLAGCPSCQQDLLAFRSVAAALDRSEAADLPPPALRARLLAAAQAEAAPRLNRRRWGSWALSAAAACILGLGLDDVRQRQRLTRTQAQLSDAQRALILQQKIADPVLAGQPLFRLAPTGGSGPSAVWVQPANNAPYLVAPDLPALRAEQTYELWFLQGTTPLPAGTFEPEHILTVAGLPPGTTALAVTVEPRGGSFAPTTPPILVGKLRE